MTPTLAAQKITTAIGINIENNTTLRRKTMKTKRTCKLIFVVADLQQHTLNVPRYVMQNVHVISSPEAGLLNEYIHKYPGFRIVVFDCEAIEF